MRLARVHELAAATGHMKRFVVFGSFVTAKHQPNDVDVFLIMHDTFDLAQVAGEARLIFDHAAAQAHFGASIFWLRGLAALPVEDEAIASLPAESVEAFCQRVSGIDIHQCPRCRLGRMLLVRVLAPLTHGPPP